MGINCPWVYFLVQLFKNISIGKNMLHNNLMWCTVLWYLLIEYTCECYNCFFLNKTQYEQFPNAFLYNKEMRHLFIISKEVLQNALSIIQTLSCFAYVKHVNARDTSHNGIWGLEPRCPKWIHYVLTCLKNLTSHFDRILFSVKD